MSFFEVLLSPLYLFFDACLFAVKMVSVIPPQMVVLLGFAIGIFVLRALFALF